ncbi:MAG TPA: FCD domain-containing protein, partial [Isosphaeraceae bacterium]|nr:FCD domain-containing protein [Isosphaeraceae bacterium]
MADKKSGATVQKRPGGRTDNRSDREKNLREKPQLIADQLRLLILTGQVTEGESLGRELDLVEEFGVSRPSLREALRILETEGLITVVRGLRGGVVAREPDHRITARTASIVLQARNVALADVFDARVLIEPLAARQLAQSRNRQAAVKELRELVRQQEKVINDPEAWGVTIGEFHEHLVARAGNQTLAIVAEMLNEVVARAIVAMTRTREQYGTTQADRRRGIRAHQKLIELIEAGQGPEAEEHWRTHMLLVAKQS